MNTKRSLLILNFSDVVTRVFLVGTVKLKSRDVPYNEVFDAQDITTIVENMGTNFVNGITEQVLLENCQSVPKESFKWGHDNFLWLTNVDLNKDSQQEGYSFLKRGFMNQ